MAYKPPAPRHLQVAWHSALFLAATAFLALIVIGRSEQRGEPHMGANVISHDVILPMIGWMPAGWKWTRDGYRR
jgi:hypothetical protein